MKLRKFQIKLIMQLPIGDYRIDDKIIIERKTIADFLSSVKNGRIFQQAYRMANLPFI
jgi:ERCC4-type nuclease